MPLVGRVLCKNIMLLVRIALESCAKTHALGLLTGLNSDRTHRLCVGAIVCVYYPSLAYFRYKIVFAVDFWVALATKLKVVILVPKKVSKGPKSCKPVPGYFIARRTTVPCSMSVRTANFLRTSCKPKHVKHEAKKCTKTVLETQKTPYLHFSKKYWSRIPILSNAHFTAKK